MIVLVVAGAVAIVTLIVQKYTYNVLSSQRQEREKRQHRVQALREEWSVRDGGTMPGVTGGSQTSSTKVVLMHSFPYWYELKSGRHSFASCNHSCTLTLDSELMEEVDSVVIYSHGFSPKVKPLGRPNQIWVYFAVESPFHSSSHVFDKPVWHHRFNWTMTYRRDSDFYFGYGDFIKPSSPIAPRNFSSLVMGKSKMVAWFVSNCNTQSRREDFVAALKDLVQVDVYGHCGDLKCGKEADPSCMDMLSREYYFYLAFENSLCKDYITEKLYRTMKMTDIIPVVRGGADYTSLLPKNSFIDVSDFASIRALADYLRQVAGDRKVYESYLAWKNEWQVIEPVPFSFCAFCQRLHHPKRWARVYPDVNAWWHQGMCHEPPFVIKS